MIRVHIRRQNGVETSTTSKALGIALVAVGLACVVLLLLGLWILLAIAFTTMAIVALVRAMLPRSRARERMAESPAIIDGKSTKLRDDNDGVGKKSSSSPFVEPKL
jgi:membrane protein implicated in regulation of membrane protease activity